MANIIIWVLENIFLSTALLAVILGVLRKSKHRNYSESILRQLFLWFVCIAFLYSGLMHLVFGDFTAAKIGWRPSPFQFEVGLANLNISVLGLMAFLKANRYFWLGAIASLSLSSVGAGLGHIYQLLAYHNYAQSNSGSVLYTDIIVPIVMFILWLRTKDNATH